MLTGRIFDAEEAYRIGPRDRPRRRRRGASTPRLRQGDAGDAQHARFGVGASTKEGDVGAPSRFPGMQAAIDPRETARPDHGQRHRRPSRGDDRLPREAARPELHQLPDPTRHRRSSPVTGGSDGRQSDAGGPNVVGARCADRVLRPGSGKWQANETGPVLRSWRSSGSSTAQRSPTFGQAGCGNRHPDGRIRSVRGRSPPIVNRVAAGRPTGRWTGIELISARRCTGAGGRGGTGRRGVRPPRRSCRGT